MTQSWAKSTWEIINYGRFIKQFPPDRDGNSKELTKSCRQDMSILFNHICINKEILPKYTSTSIYIYNIYI